MKVTIKTMLVSVKINLKNSIALEMKSVGTPCSPNQPIRSRITETELQNLTGHKLSLEMSNSVDFFAFFLESGQLSITS